MTAERFNEIAKELDRCHVADIALVNPVELFGDYFGQPTPSRDAYIATLADGEYAEYLAVVASIPIS